MRFSEISCADDEAPSKSGHETSYSPGQLTFGENEEEKSFEVTIIDDDAHGRDTE